MNPRFLFRSVIIASVVAASLSLPATARRAAPSFQATPGFISLNQLAVRLQGKDFRTEPRFPAYCQRYSQVAQAQARRRIQSGCASQIPLRTWNIQKRWRQARAGHRNWCNSVSSYASGNEARTREQQLRRCITNPPRLTRQQCQRNDKFHKAAAHGNLRFVRQCLNIGVNVNLRERNNWTALHSAARNGRLNIVKLLVRHRAAINPRDVNGRTPLDQAKVGRRQAVINYLTSRGGV